uniref:Leucine rich repeat containing 71 n=1 Tax=Nothobranchius furzeri TaxID=105023 RepID=A0A8C6PB69_NOTFU
LKYTTMFKGKLDKLRLAVGNRQISNEYQCTGNVETDFPELCALLGVKNIPEVCTKSSTITRSEGVDAGKRSVECMHVEQSLLFWGKLALLLFGSCLFLLSCPLCGRLWHAGLTDQMVASLANTLPLCSSLRVVSLEGNVLQDQSFHLLFTESCVLTQLHLRCNRIGDEGARLIGSALSTPTSANKNLVYLNLAFNWIGDAGAACSVLNSIIHFQILVDFPLTHEEIVERRKLTLQRIRAVSVTIISFLLSFQIFMFVEQNVDVTCLILKLTLQISDLRPLWWIFFSVLSPILCNRL